MALQGFSGRDDIESFISLLVNDTGCKIKTKQRYNQYCQIVIPSCPSTVVLVFETDLRKKAAC